MASTPVPAVTIVGAGPVGTLLAILLARAGQRVRLVEQRADPRLAQPARGRSINLALAARGLAALRTAGVLEQVQPFMVQMDGRQLHEPGGASRFMRYGQQPDEVLQAIGREQLNTALVTAAAALPEVELRFGQHCVDVDPAAGTLQLRDAATGAIRTEATALLVGADGAGSAVRQAMATRSLVQVDVDPLEHDYKELTMPPAADGSAVLYRHALHIWPRGGYMLIALPNPDHSFTATLFLPARGADSFESLRAPGAAREFFARQFPDALELVPDFDAQYAQHPEGKLATLQCWPWHHRQALLIGDAAHAIVPFHGQGLNCGFEDCVLLAQLLAGDRDAAGPSDAAAACAAFERRRRPDTDAIAWMAVENYQEMRERVLAPDFALRRQLGAELEARFPGRYIPRYSMVMFHPEIGYAEALRRGALQEQVIDALLAAGMGAASDEAARLLQESGL